MSAPKCGDWVFVHPQEPTAPREVLGLAGVVEQVAGSTATVSFRGAEGSFAFDVDVEVLSPERRRRDRAPAQWSGGAHVPAG
ncbi:MAG: hypothetical protein ACXVQQ_01620 [Gaiellaceae bacterium]